MMDRKNKESKGGGKLKRKKEGRKDVKEGEGGLLYQQTHSLDVPVPGAC